MIARSSSIQMANDKGWGQIAKLLQIKIYLSDLGITWHSCSGMYPEAIAQLIPPKKRTDSVKSFLKLSLFAMTVKISFRFINIKENK